MSDEKRVTIRVFGLVQGVFFRANTLKKARELGVLGFVRNLADDSVEIVVQGKQSLVDNMIEWAKNGEAPARVERVEVVFSKDLDQDLKAFHIR